MKRFVAYAIVIIATLVGLLLLWESRLVVGIFLLSLLLTAAVRPIIVRLTARGLPKALGTLLTYVSGLLLLGLGLYFLSGPLVAELDLLADRLTATYDRFYPYWQAGNAFEQALASRLPPPARLYDLMAAEEGQLLAQTLFMFTRNLISVLSGAVLIVVLSIYWSADQERFERLWLSLLPPEKRGRGRDIWRAVETGIGSYIRNEGALSFIAFFLLVLVYAAVGINYPILLALLGAVAWLIPIVGFIFMIVPAFLSGLASSLAVAVAVTLYTGLVLLVLEFVIQPSLFRRRRVYSPILVILLIIPLASLYGLLGVLMAPPLAVVIQILLGSLFRRRRMEVEAIYPSAQVERLSERLADTRLQIEEEPPPEIASLAERLDSLLARAEERLDALPLSLLETSLPEAPPADAQEEQV